MPSDTLSKIRVDSYYTDGDNLFRVIDTAVYDKSILVENCYDLSTEWKPLSYVREHWCRIATYEI